MKRILVPYDFSVQAKNALKLAVEIASQTHAHIDVLNIVEWPLQEVIQTIGSESDEFIALQGRVRDRQRTNESRLKEDLLSNQFSLVDVSCSSLIERVDQGIVNASLSRETDLIIMGTKGASGIKEVFVGSNTEKVVRKAPCPVLTLHEKINIGAIENIVFATNLYDTYEEVITELQKIQSLVNAHIHVVKVNTPDNFQNQEETDEQLSQFIKKHNLVDCTPNVYNHRSVEAGVLKFARKLPNCLIAIGTHGRIGLDHILSGSIAEDLTNHSEIPVLTIRTSR